MKNGTGHFVAQRVTAIALIVLGLWFGVAASGLEIRDYGIVVAFVAEPLNAVLLTVMCMTLAYHSYLGIQVVIEDYVHGSSVKGASLLASKIAHVLVVSLSTYAILTVGLGA